MKNHHSRIGFEYIIRILVLFSLVISQFAGVVSPAHADGTITGTFTLWHNYGGLEATALDQVILDAETANPGLDIVPSFHTWPGIFAEYESAVQSGGGPYLLLASTDEVGDQARAGVVLNIDSLLTGKLGAFNQTAVDGLKVDGVMYGVPVSGKVIALYYNKSLIPTPPTTTAELLSLVQGGATITSPSDGAGGYNFYGFWNAFGGQLMDANGLCIADQGGVSDAMQYLLDLQTAGANLLATYDNANNSFINGNASMVINGTWVLNDYKTALGNDLGMVPLPAGPSGNANPMADPDGFFVNPNTLDPNGAVNLALYLTNQSSSQTLTDIGNSIPVRSDVTSAEQLVNDFASIFNQGEPRTKINQLNNYWVPFNDMVSAVLSGSVTPQAGVLAACTMMNLLDGPKVSGTITDNNGNPLEVTVRAVLASDGTELATTTSRPDGTYNLVGLPLDTEFLVVASDENPNTDGIAAKYFNNVETSDWAEPITLTSGNINRIINFSLNPNGGATLEHLTFNVRAGRLLNDLEIRRAIAYGTDRVSIRDNAFVPNGITGEILNAIVDPASWYAANPTQLTVYDYNPTMAGNILTAAGWVDTDADGIRENASNDELVLDFITTTAPIRVDASNLFKNQMQALGIQVNVFNIDGTTFFSEDPGISRLAAGDFDIAEFAWANSGEYDSLLAVYNSTDPQNLGGFSDAALDGNFNDARAAKVAGNLALFESNALLWQQTFADDLPALPLFTRTSIPQPPSITVQPDHGWINGDGWPVGNTVTVTVDNDNDPLNGTLYFESQIVAGDSSVNFNNVESIVDLVPGQYIVMSDGTTTKELQISEVHFNFLNQITNVASGTGPADQPANVYIRTTTEENNLNIIIAPDGNWTADFTGLLTAQNIQDANIKVFDNDGDGTMAHLGLPHLDVWYLNDFINAYDWPVGTTVDLTITNAPNPDYTATELVGADHTAQFNLGGIFDIQPGMTVTVSGSTMTRELVVANLSITSINEATDTIAGTTEPNRNLWMWYQASCCRNFQSDAEGNWVVNYSVPGPNGEPTADIGPGSTGTVNVIDEDGDNTSVDWNTPNPSVQVRANNNSVEGWDFPDGSTVTITISRPGETITRTTLVASSLWDPRPYYRYDFNGQFDIQVGDVVEVTEGTAPDLIIETTIVTNLAITDIDLETDIVTGVASPGANVDTWVCNASDCNYRRHVTADGITGIWTADFGHVGTQGDEQTLANLQPGSWIDSIENDVNWNGTMYGVDVPKPTLFARLGLNLVQSENWPEGATLALTIDDPTTPANPDYSDNTNTAQLNNPADPSSGTFADYNLGSYTLKPGDEITLTGGGETKSMVVADLYITDVNADGNIISGTAGVGVDIVSVRMWTSPTEVVVDSNVVGGLWTADFNGIYDLHPGDNGVARWWDVNGHMTSDYFSIPYSTLHVNRKDNEVHGHDWPMASSVTLTIDDDTDPFNGILYEETKLVSADTSCGTPCFNLLGTFNLEVGQYVTMSGDGVTKTVHISQHTVTSIDPVTDTISGIADPFSNISVDFHSSPSPMGQVVTTDSSGHWAANFTGMYDLVPGDFGRALQLNPDGTDDGTLEYWELPIDATPPTVISITRNLANPTNASIVSYIITFSEDVTGVDRTDFNLTGLSDASIISVGRTGSTRIVSVNTGTGSGSLSLDLTDNDSIKDGAGNALGGSGLSNGDFTGGESYTLDRTPPTVVSIARNSANPTNAANVSFVVTFSEAVTGIDKFDFVLTPSGSISSASVVSVSGTGATRTVSVSTGNGSGTLRLDVSDNDTIKDTVTNSLGGPGSGNGNFSAGESFTIDKNPPVVLSIARASANPTNAATLSFTVTFSEPVTGVDTSDFAPAQAAGVTGAAVSSLTGSGSVYNIIVNTGSNSGTLGLNLVDNDSIRDAVTNPLGGAGSGNGNFTTGEFYSIDKTSPLVTSIVRSSANPTNAANVNFTVNFSKPVTGVDKFDFSIVPSGTISGATITSVGGTGSARTVTVNIPSGTGTVKLDVADNDSIKDALLNPLGGSGTGNGNFTTGESYTIDRTAPSVVSIIRGSVNPTNAANVTFNVTFSEAVTGVDKFDFSIVPSGTVAGAAVTSVSGTGTTRAVTVNIPSGTGTVRLDLMDNDTIMDALLNPLGGAGTVNGDYASGQVYTVDRTAPSVVSILRTSADPTNAANVIFNVTFSEAVTGVDKFDFSIVPSGTIAGAAVTNVSGTGTTRAITVNIPSGTGTVRLDVTDNDSIKDALLNPLGGSGTGNGNFNSGQTYTIDRTPPSVVSIVRTSANPTSAASVSFLVTFSKTVTGVDKFDFSLVTPGITGASIISVSGTSVTRTVTVSTGTGAGTIRLDLIDNDTIKDALLNSLGGSGAGNGNFYTGEIYTKL